MGTTVEFQMRDFSAAFSPPNLSYTVAHYSHAVLGGSKEAVITAFGDENELWRLIDMLRCPVTLSDDDAEEVWWGYIAAVEIRVGWITVGVTLDEMTNSVTVAYTSFGIRKDTSEAVDQVSVGAYGTRQLHFTLSDATDAEAQSRRDTELAQCKYPPATISLSGEGEGGYSATITGRGWFDTLDWKYYSQTKGLEQYTADGTGQQKIGPYYSSSQISFIASSTITDAASGLGNFERGDYITFYGTASNNGVVFPVSEGTSTGYEIEVDNSTASLVNEASGTSFSVSTASSIAQSFTQRSGSAWDASSVHLRLQTIGSPNDNLKLGIYSSVSGSVGAIQASALVAASDLSETMLWKEIPLAASVTLTNASSYFLIATRTGPISGCGYYRTDVNEEAGYPYGSFQLSAGSGGAWRGRNVDADLLFKISGTQLTTEQMREILQTAGQFFQSIDMAISSSVETNQYRDGEATAKTELEALLATGTSACQRMLAAVYGDRRIKIYAEPVAGASNYQITTRKALYDQTDTPVKFSKCPYGVWVTLKDIIPEGIDVSRIANANTFFIDEADYFPESQTYVPRAKNNLAVWDINPITQG